MDRQKGNIMDFAYSSKVEELRERVRGFMDTYIVPRQRQWLEEVHRNQFPVSFMADLKALAKSEGLWNMFLPSLHADEPGTGLTNLEYAPLAEIMGRVSWASEVFNCNAPDTGNMELLHMFGTPEQQKAWLRPLLEGEIRSAFAMTEPDVASSDATNITTLIRREGDEYVINGRKWFITNAAHPHCRIFIVMGKTDPEAERHKQQSMIQVRLGLVRIHHCIRSFGAAELALEMMIARSLERRSFGKFLHQHATVG